MKHLTMLLIIFFPRLLFASEEDSSRYWQQNQCSKRSLRETRILIEDFERRLRELRVIEDSCASTPAPTSNESAEDCAVYFTSKNMYPSAIAETCKGLNSEQFSCIKYLVDRNQYARHAKSICQSDNLNYDCLRFMIEKNQYPSTAANLCSGLNAPQFECTKELILRNHYPSTAKSTCQQVTRAGLECVRLMLNAKSNPSEAKDLCVGVSRARLNCITPMLKRGVVTGTAKSLCLVIP